MIDRYKHKTWHEKRAAESTGDPVADALDLVIRQRDALMAENEQLRNALELFANEENWSKVATIDGWAMTAWNEHGPEPSDIACKALEGKNE